MLAHNFYAKSVFFASTLALLLAVGSQFLPVAIQAQSESDGLEWTRTGGKLDAQKILDEMPAGYRFEHIAMPMRDGTRLATTIFRPTDDGKYPVVLIRTPYQRASGVKYFKNYCEKTKYVCIAQDPRARGDSEGTTGSISCDHEIQDGYDTIDWIAKQPWCNGRVGMTGSSGNGLCAAMAYFSKHPNLVVVAPGNTAPNTALNWAFENGVRRKLYDWMGNYGIDRGKLFPRPTLPEYDRSAWAKICEQAAPDNHIVYIAGDGWFNIFGDGNLDFFSQFAKTGKIFFHMSAGAHGHGCNKGFLYKMRGSAQGAVIPPSFFAVLDGTATIPEKSQMTYAVLGSHDDPAIGNINRVADTWPPANKPTHFYLGTDNKLSTTPPTTNTSTEKTSYIYDPADPVPTLGGGWSYGDEPNGAVDQRPISSRKDILRFVTEPLNAALEIGGKIRADLWIASSAPDTLFVVKLVDIYPDGREILLREAAGMARYREGFDKPTPLTPDTPTRFVFDCNSMAAVFAPGHRIGIFITSSSAPAYEVHPNTYEPCPDTAAMQPATQTIFTSEKFPSAIILPVRK